MKFGRIILVKIPKVVLVPSKRTSTSKQQWHFIIFSIKEDELSNETQSILLIITKNELSVAQLMQVLAKIKPKRDRESLLWQ